MELVRCRVAWEDAPSLEKTIAPAFPYGKGEGGTENA